MESFRQRVFTLLEPGEQEDWPSKLVDLFLILLIVANVVVSILETVPEALSEIGHLLAPFEAISIAVFTIEYLLRVWSCTSSGYSPVSGRLRFIMSPMLLIDLLAVLPFYLAFLGLDLRMVRIVRILRVLRIAKMGRYSRSMRILGRSIWVAKDELSMTVLLGGFALVLSATLIYYTEHGSQPEVFPSIPASFWWAVTTLTTVGYGDAYPVTLLGKIFGGISQVLGVGLIALPTGVLATSYFDQMNQERTREGYCSQCGRPMEE